MLKLTVKREILAPQSTVFARCSDFAGAPGRIPAIVRVEMLTKDPVGIGTRFRETRVMFKREASEEMEVTGFDPPHSYTLGCTNHGCRYETVFRFSPTARGTDVEMTFVGVPLTTGAKILSFIFRPLMKSMAKMCAKDLEDIKAAIEREVRPAG